MLNEIFPAVYRRLRLRAGLTQAELGKRLGLCRATVYKYESGKARPGATQEQALLKLASCSDREWVELICEQLSGVVLARVVVLDDRGENEPANLLAKANAVIAQGRTAHPQSSVPSPRQQSQRHPRVWASSSNARTPTSKSSCGTASRRWRPPRALRWAPRTRRSCRVRYLPCRIGTPNRRAMTERNRACCSRELETFSNR